MTSMSINPLKKKDFSQNNDKYQSNKTSKKMFNKYQLHPPNISFLLSIVASKSKDILVNKKQLK